MGKLDVSNIFKVQKKLCTDFGAGPSQSWIRVMPSGCFLAHCHDGQGVWFIDFKSGVENLWRALKKLIIVGFVSLYRSLPKLPNCVDNRSGTLGWVPSIMGRIHFHPMNALRGKKAVCAVKWFYWSWHAWQWLWSMEEFLSCLVRDYAAIPWNLMLWISP